MPFNITFFILSVYLICAFLYPIGVAGVISNMGITIALLQLLQEVSKGITNINYKGGISQKRDSITILK